MEVPSTHSCSDAWTSLTSSKLVSLDKVSPRSDTETKCHARNMLDQEIGDALNAVTSVKTFRNSLVPIHRLPLDVLFKIFFTLATQEPSIIEIRTGEWTTESRYSQLLDVFKLAHVCCYWKDIVLQSPLLWTQIPLHKPTYRPYADLTPTVKSTLSQNHRLGSLSLATVANTTFEYLSTPAPLLKSLQLDSDNTCQDNTEPNIPLDIFARYAPNLRRFISHGLGVCWRSPIMNNLTHLEVHANSKAFTENRGLPSKSPVDDVLDALQRMPCLTTLILRYAVPTFPAGSATHRGAYPIIQLASVTYLSLAGPLFDCGLLVQRLAVHPDASLSYCCYEDNRSLPNDLCSIIRPTQFSYKVWATHDFQIHDITEWDSRPYLSLHWDTFEPARDGMIARETEAMFRLIPFDTVRVLSGDLTSSLLSTDGGDGWRVVWGRANSVEKILTGSQPLSPLIKAWAEPIPGQTPIQHLFPLLKKLTIYNVNFDGWRWDPKLTDFEMAIKARKLLGLALEELSLWYCRIDEDDINHLKKLVDKIFWDQKFCDSLVRGWRSSSSELASTRGCSPHFSTTSSRCTSASTPPGRRTAENPFNLQWKELTYEDNRGAVPVAAYGSHARLDDTVKWASKAYLQFVKARGRELRPPSSTEYVASDALGDQVKETSSTVECSCRKIMCMNGMNQATVRVNIISYLKYFPALVDPATFSSEAWSFLTRSRLVSVDTTSSRSDPQSISHARKVLDREINDALEAIRYVKALRNSLLPIHRLPPDILFKIFHIIATQNTGNIQINAASGKRASRYCEPLDVYKLTHVCRRWKDFALQFPLLWTNIPVHKAKWASEFLSRSQSAPLILFLDLSSKGLSPAVRTALSHARRIQKLTLKGPINSALIDLITPAPALESLTIKAAWIRGSGKTDALLWPNLFAKGAPKLRRIVTRRINFPWHLAVFNNLTYLEVHQASYKPSSAGAGPRTISVDELSHSLRRMPNLTTLILHNCIPVFLPDAPVESGTDHVVYLPSVMFLSLAGPILDCVLLAQRLVVHTDASLAYDCRVDACNLPGQSVSEVIEASRQYNIQISADTHSRVKTTSKWSARPYLSITWDGSALFDEAPEDARAKISREAQSLLRTFSLDSVRVLEGDLDCSLLDPDGWKGVDDWDENWREADGWYRVWGCATAVEKILISDTLLSFLETWTEPASTSEETPDAPNQYLFPCLKKMCIYAVDFCNPESDFVNPDNLERTLKDRDQLGLPLDELSIRGCRIDFLHIHALKKVVKKVIWDGDDYGLGDPDDC
ncbi:hypothetical protein EVG20_g5254 [Dentipellis fragilis]|uniref:F-box domain-containing protein n=1 Tax=Dentipellis fragilis TaxID=205917 RepID=A0A4Y9YUH0_9AGAM|nr:hypothetical protein EVG20_g5254 [Dentipellis fragilis]